MGSGPAWTCSGADRTYERRRALWRWDALVSPHPLPLSSFAGEGRPEPCAGAFQCGTSHVGSDVLSALKPGPAPGPARFRHYAGSPLWEGHAVRVHTSPGCAGILPAFQAIASETPAHPGWRLTPNMNTYSYALPIPPPGQIDRQAGRARSSRAFPPGRGADQRHSPLAPPARESPSTTTRTITGF